jgi:hypothetical protein
MLENIALKILGVIIAVLLTALVWHLLPEGKASHGQNTIIGERERIRVISPEGAAEILANIDTGATSSALDIAFAKSIGLEPSGQQKAIITARGMEMRDTVAFTFVLADRRISTVATLVDRSHLSTTVLVGKEDLKGFLVDPTKKFLSEPRAVDESSFFPLLFRDVWKRPGNEIIMLFPVLGAVVVVLRLIVGVRTFGLFAPVAMAFSVYEVDILPGILIYTFLIVFGMGVKILVLNRFQMPQIVEMSLIMFITVVSIMGILMIGAGTSLPITSVFFPLIITTHLIERATKTVEQARPMDAGVLLVSTMVTAVLLAILFKIFMEQAVVPIWVIFVISMLVTLAASRYAGYRLTEFFRFKVFRK